MRVAVEGVRSGAAISVQLGRDDLEALAYAGTAHPAPRRAVSDPVHAFDPRRTAILLLGGKKTGDPRWYETAVRIADRLYDEYIAELKREGLIDD